MTYFMEDGEYFIRCCQEKETGSFILWCRKRMMCKGCIFENFVNLIHSFSDGEIKSGTFILLDDEEPL